jgi:hypothetical protein
MAKLSDSQLVVLSAACQRPDRSVYPLTAKLPGGAAAKVLNSLLNKELIKEVQAKREDTVWREDKKRGRMTLRATPAAFEALGIDKAEAPAEVADKLATEESATGEAPADEPAAAGHTAEAGSTKKRRRKSADAKKASGPQANTKQARLIEMLKRPNGATIDDIVKKLDWQAHTVRGAIAGALKKKLGLNVTSEKDEKRGRVYRVC